MIPSVNNVKIKLKKERLFRTVLCRPDLLSPDFFIQSPACPVPQPDVRFSSHHFPTVAHFTPADRSARFSATTSRPSLISHPLSALPGFPPVAASIATRQNWV